MKKIISITKGLRIISIIAYIISFSFLVALQNHISYDINLYGFEKTEKSSFFVVMEHNPFPSVIMIAAGLLICATIIIEFLIAKRKILF